MIISRLVTLPAVRQIHGLRQIQESRLSHVTVAINHPTSFGVKRLAQPMTWYWFSFEIYITSLGVPFITTEVCPSSKS
jgi:hypothetical protein